MKKIYTIIVSAFMILLAVGCQKNDILPDGEEPVVAGKVYTAVMEQAGSGSANTKISVNVADDGSTATLAWEDNDVISVVGSPNEVGSNIVTENYNLSLKINNTASFTLASINFPAYALFGAVPATHTSAEPGKLVEPAKITLPSSYGTAAAPYKSGTFTAPMHADMSNYVASNVQFRHMAGVIKITFLEVPAGYDTFIFTSNNNNICGDFDVTEERYLKTVRAGDGQGNGKSITYTFAPKNDATQAMTFYVPLPLGTYDGFSCELKKNGTNISVAKETLNSITVTRCKLALMPEVSGFNYEIDRSNGVTTYVVSTAAGLQEVNAIVNANGGNITLGADIDLTDAPKPYDDGKSNWEALSGIGTFDGQGHSIKGLEINSESDYQGLLGYQYGGFMVVNLELINCSIISSGTNVGAFAAYSWSGTVENCTLKAEGTGDVNIQGLYNVGGIVGRNGWGTYGGGVYNCSVINTGSGTISILGKDANNASNGYNIGGIAGTNYEKIENCKVLNSGTGSILISGDAQNVGGISGFNAYSSSGINGCIAKNINITGAYQVGGILGKIKNSSYLISCYAENVSVNMTSTGSTIGGIIGLHESGTVTACYAYMPNITNIVGTGTVTFCYYYTSSVTTAGNVFGLDGGEVPWGDAMSDMNGAAGSTGYQWSGTWDTPILNAPGSN